MRDGSVGAGSTIRPSNARPRWRSSAVTDRSGCSSRSPRSSTNTWWSGVSVRPSEPKSGFVSTATMRSRRTRASSEPSSTVSVVFPTPPFGDTIAIVEQRVSRGAAIARSSRAS